MKVISQFNTSQIQEAKAKNKAAASTELFQDFAAVVKQLSRQGRIQIAGHNDLKQLDFQRSKEVQLKNKKQDAEEESLEDIFTRIEEILNAKQNDGRFG